MTLHWETSRQKGKRYFDMIVQLGGTIKTRGGVTGIFFDGPKDAPENSLFVPLNDFGYSRAHGIFRKSLRPEYESEVNF